MSKIVGIDPGLSGGIAIWSGGNLSEAFAMPVIKGAGLNLHQIANALDNADLVVIEKATAMPGQGVTSMFSFGLVYGVLQGLCAGKKIPFEIVTPQSWKKQILAGTQKDKAAAIDYCTRNYPNISLIPEGCRKPRDGIADAICILLYGVIKFPHFCSGSKKLTPSG